MKIFLITASVILLAVFSACSNNTAKDIYNSDKANPDTQQVSRPTKKTSIKPNRSEVLAELTDKNVADTTDFSLTVKILSVARDFDGSSIASEGATYSLRPALILGGNKEILKDPRNQKLLKLKDLKKGDKFKAYIYMNSENQWIIQEVLD